MGVKDLWQVIGPVCERKSLWELQDKILAIDLSGWVCDSQNVTDNMSQPNMYLRNLFFRTSALLLLGAHPIFVLEGIAPELKAAVMDQRMVARGFSQSQKSSTNQAQKGKRSKLKSIQKKCCELLDYLGVNYIQSEGEAEALCALLNKRGLVDGCISQDSDCFLYGAETVYRNFTITATNSSSGGPAFSIDSYSMTALEKCLGLTRNKLIALSLLCGCDYHQQGVAGVGKESALKFIATLDDDSVLDRLRQWRADLYYDQLEQERILGGCEQCGHIGKKKTHMKDGCSDCNLGKGCVPSFNPRALCQMEPEQRKTIIAELSIRKKALADPEFPSEEVIKEFLRPDITVPYKLNIKWSQPNFLGFLRLAVRVLNWDEIYAFNKFLPIITRWVILQKGARGAETDDSCPVYPVEIKKARVLRGVASYEILWSDKSGLFDSVAKSTQSSESDTTGMFCTIEPKSLVEKAYPDLVNNYVTQIEEAKKAKRKGKSRSKKVPEKNATDQTSCETCGGHDGCLCRFTNVKSKGKSEAKTVTHRKKRVPKDSTDKTQSSLSPFLQTRKKEKASLHDSLLEQMLETSLTLDDDYGELDLSSAVMSIVGTDTYFQDLSKKEKSETKPVSPEPCVETKSHDTVSSDDDFETHIPFLERIKMKSSSASQKSSYSQSSSLSDFVCSPVRKKPKHMCNESNSHPYSPLADQPSKIDPRPTNRRSIVESEVARRFSVSLETFSRKDPDATSPVKTLFENSDSDFDKTDDRFDLGVTRFLNGDDE